MALGKFNVSHAPAEDVDEFVALARRMVRDYHWEDRVTYPYSYPDKVVDLIKAISDYRYCTYSSQSYLLALANGLADVMNKWEEIELTGVNIVSVKTGRVYKVSKDDVDFYLEDGLFVKEI